MRQCGILGAVGIISEQARCRQERKWLPSFVWALCSPPGVRSGHTAEGFRDSW